MDASIISGEAQLCGFAVVGIYFLSVFESVFDGIDVGGRACTPPCFDRRCACFAILRFLCAVIYDEQ